MKKLFKPMLAGKLTKIESLKFPVLVSIKLDGIRATVQGGQLLSRSLKPLPNKAIQRLFKGLPEGLDGELILGDPAAPDAFRKTTSKVMSPDEDSEGIVFHVFDIFDDAPFVKRCGLLYNAVMKAQYAFVRLVQQYEITDQEKLEAFEAKTLEAGHEGVMVRSMNGPYKEGRSTEKEGSLLKLKRFEHGEAIVIGVEELMHNDNVALKNELGRTHRQTLQENLRPAGVLGKLVVTDLVTGVEFGIGTGFNADERAKFWNMRGIMGRIVRYKYFPTGGKDRPRFPVFEGFRDKIDM